jgi:hypothetical protein
MTETVFYVPKLNQASVACGGCCPVPAEAVLLPELELVPGVQEADADWQKSEIRVRHAAEVNPAELANLLDELSYPAHSWHTRVLDGSGGEGGGAPSPRSGVPKETGIPTSLGGVVVDSRQS